MCYWREKRELCYPARLLCKIKPQYAARIKQGDRNTGSSVSDSQFDCHLQIWDLSQWWSSSEAVASSSVTRSWAIFVATFWWSKVNSRRSLIKIRDLFFFHEKLHIGFRSRNDDNQDPTCFLGETHRVVSALATVMAFQGLDTKRTDKYFSVLSLNFLPPLTHNVILNTFWATFESLKALIRSSLIAFAMITRIESLRHSATTSTKLRSHIEPLGSLGLSLHWMYPSVGVRQNLDDPDVCSLLNSNFWVQLFALFAVLRVLWIVLALRTPPLDDEEDDNEKNDHCEKDPDHDRHQKSIWIPRRWVDFALERKQVFIKMYFQISQWCIFEIS